MKKCFKLVLILISIQSFPLLSQVPNVLQKVDMLLSELQTDHCWTQIRIVNELANIGIPASDAIGVLVERLSKIESSEPGFFRVFSKAINKINPKAALPFLIQRLEQGNDLEKYNAVMMLVDLHYPVDQTVYAKLVKTIEVDTTTPDTFVAIAWAMSRIAPMQAVRDLKTLVKNNDRDLKNQYLKSFGSGNVLSYLSKKIIPEAQIRAEAKWLYKQMKSKLAQEKHTRVSIQGTRRDPSEPKGLRKLEMTAGLDFENEFSYQCRFRQAKRKKRKSKKPFGFLFGKVNFHFGGGRISSSSSRFEAGATYGGERRPKRRYRIENVFSVKEKDNSVILTETMSARNTRNPHLIRNGKRRKWSFPCPRGFGIQASSHIRSWFALAGCFGVERFLHPSFQFSPFLSKSFKDQPIPFRFQVVKKRRKITQIQYYFSALDLFNEVEWGTLSSPMGTVAVVNVSIDNESRLPTNRVLFFSDLTQKEGYLFESEK